MPTSPFSPSLETPKIERQLGPLAVEFVRDCAENRAVRTPEMHARAADSMPDELARSTMRRVRDSAARRRYVVYSLGAT